MAAKANLHTQESRIDRRNGRHNLAGMFPRLTRIMLALVTAFVFTGQVEAAAQHCARLAEQVTLVAAAETEEAAPCHATQSAVVAAHGDHAAAPDHHAEHSKSPDRCECIAALKGCADLEAAAATTKIEPYAWLLPARAAFASTKPEPDWRPPRA